jgi:hypothetical protein
MGNALDDPPRTVAFRNDHGRGSRQPSFGPKRDLRKGCRVRSALLR